MVIKKNTKKTNFLSSTDRTQKVDTGINDVTTAVTADHRHSVCVTCPGKSQFHAPMWMAEKIAPVK